eukprot:18084-Heterococcus_DN1.PRE.3
MSLQHAVRLVQLKQQLQWLEEDEDRVKDREKESEGERAEEASAAAGCPARSRYVNAQFTGGITPLEAAVQQYCDAVSCDDADMRAHHGWKERKKRLRIRLPQEPEPQPGGVWKPPRFDFSAGKGLVRPNKEQIARTTVDLMRESGAKYAYAMSAGLQGQEGDLEKSKYVQLQHTTAPMFPSHLSVQSSL